MNHEAWNTESRISLLRRWILVHSILYYEMDESVVSDEEYDSKCRELVRLCREDMEASDRADYHYCMHDFDASTGFDLYSRLEEHDRRHLEGLARSILKSYKGGSKG